MAQVKIISLSVQADKVETGMPVQYIVGQAPVEGAAMVEKINAFQTRYNGGNQGDFPCYVVYFSDGTRRLFTIPMIGLVDVAKVEGNTTNDDGPELPE